MRWLWFMQRRRDGEKKSVNAISSDTTEWRKKGKMPIVKASKKRISNPK
jgi:hypothetical protein